MMTIPDDSTPQSAPAVPNQKGAGAALHTILVATDYSNEAAAAIQHALKLAKLTGAEISVLHVVELKKPEINPEVVAAVERLQSNFSAIQQRAMERLDALCKDIQTPGVRCTARIRLGIPYEEILEDAEETHPDLVIIGKKGSSGLARFLLGGTAARVARYAPCSVLIVHS